MSWDQDKKPAPAWDNTQASAEGWDVFTRSDGRLEIEKDDELDIFPTDDAALDHVIAQATAGSAYHLRALSIVAKQDWNAGRQYIVVYGNYGRFKADLDTGAVFDLDESDSDANDEANYRDVIGVDVAELKASFPPVNIGDSWCITLVGCFNKDGSFDDPTPSRQIWLEHAPSSDFAEMIKASIKPKPYRVTVTATVPVWKSIDVEASNPNAAIQKAKDTTETTWTVQCQHEQVSVTDRDMLGEVEIEVEQLQLPEIDGVLKNARLVAGGHQISGDIYGDRKGRFRDGECVRTSRIVSGPDENGIVTTRNSVYRVEFASPAATNKKIVLPGLTFGADEGTQATNDFEFNPAMSMDGWWCLTDDEGIQLYASSERLICFIQRIIDPTRWQFLTLEEKVFLRKAAG